MNKPLLALLVFFAVAAGILVSCNKEQDDYYQINADVKSLADLKINSQIIMRDSINPFITDSLWVSHYTPQSYKPNGKYSGWEELDITLSANLFKLHFEIKGGNYLWNTTYNSYEYKNPNRPQDHGFVSGWLAAVASETSGFSYNGLTQISKLDETTVSGKIYRNVYLVEGISSSSIPATYWRSLYNKDEALILLEIKNDSLHRVWQQVSSNLIR